MGPGGRRNELKIGRPRKAEMLRNGEAGTCDFGVVGDRGLIREASSQLSSEGNAAHGSRLPGSGENGVWAQWKSEPCSHPSIDTIDPESCAINGHVRHKP